MRGGHEKGSIDRPCVMNHRGLAWVLNLPLPASDLALSSPLPHLSTTTFRYHAYRTFSINHFRVNPDKQTVKMSGQGYEYKSSGTNSEVLDDPSSRNRQKLQAMTDVSTGKRRATTTARVTTAAVLPTPTPTTTLTRELNLLLLLLVRMTITCPRGLLSRTSYPRNSTSAVSPY